MQEDAGKWLVICLAASFIIGVLIVIFNKNYRPEKILKTNKNYYAELSVDKFSHNNNSTSDQEE